MPTAAMLLDVYCDMDTEPGGWTVFQHRFDGSVDFSRVWASYKEGFGNLDGEFWLGLDNIHFLTTMAPSELRVDLEDQDGNERFAIYDKFHVDTEASKYRLTLGSYRGNADDAMTYHNGQKFSTRDQDNDEHSAHCAQLNLGAWWYKECQLANLNGQYNNNNLGQGLTWYYWRGFEHSMMTTSMKLRRIS